MVNGYFELKPLLQHKLLNIFHLDIYFSIFIPDIQV